MSETRERYSPLSSPSLPPPLSPIASLTGDLPLAPKPWEDTALHRDTYLSLENECKESVFIATRAGDWTGEESKLGRLTSWKVHIWWGEVPQAKANHCSLGSFWSAAVYNGQHAPCHTWLFDHLSSGLLSTQKHMLLLGRQVLSIRGCRL